MCNSQLVNYRIIYSFLAGCFVSIHIIFVAQQGTSKIETLVNASHFNFTAPKNTQLKWLHYFLLSHVNVIVD